MLRWIVFYPKYNSHSKIRIQFCISEVGITYERTEINSICPTMDRVHPFYAYVSAFRASRAQMHVYIYILRYWPRFARCPSLSIPIRLKYAISLSWKFSGRFYILAHLKSFRERTFFKPMSRIVGFKMYVP